jgi:ribosomal protein S18 acetylase RimI-like enzyme
MTSAIPIRPAAPGDEAALALVGAATFLESYAGVVHGGDIVPHCRQQHSAEHYARWLADDAYRLWLATLEPGEAPIGYLVLGPADLPLADLSCDDLEVKRIYVLSRFHRLGVGRALMQTAKEESRRRHARRLLLGVYSQNDRAIAFYQREGFATVGTRTFQVGRHQYHDLILGTPLA